MKKMITLMATLALAASALAADATSANIVGYTKIGFTANQQKMLGMQFTRVNDNGAPFSLAELPFEMKDWVDAEIQVAYMEGESLEFETYTMRNWGPGYDGWINSSYQYAGDTEIDIGQGFWLLPGGNSGTITFISPVAGE